jgi:tetratricopeptide (TPR) repeat protein
MPPMANAPFAGGGMAGGGGDNSKAAEDIAKLDKKIAELTAKGDKKELAAAYADRGFAQMNDPGASPRVKYRAALKDYRQALKLDPNNGKAKFNAKLIEDIYRSMGRPVPTEG